MGFLEVFTAWIDDHDNDDHDDDEKVADRYRLGRGEVSHLGFGRSAGVIGRPLGRGRTAIVKVVGGSRTGLLGGGGL